MYTYIHTYIKHIFGLIQSSISKYFVNVSSYLGTGRSRNPTLWCILFQKFVKDEDRSVRQAKDLEVLVIPSLRAAGRSDRSTKYTNCVDLKKIRENFSQKFLREISSGVAGVHIFWRATVAGLKGFS